MRISVSGTTCIGKSTFVQDFCNHWTNYTSPRYSYRDELAKLPHSKTCNKDTQWLILNSMIDELQKHSAKDHVIFDRGPLDNLVYSMWAFDKGEGDIDAEFIAKCVPLVRESMRFLDIIFFVPITRVAPVQLVENGLRETDPSYIEEIDNIFKALVQQYQLNIETTQFFPKGDCPGIIEMFGKREERIYLAQQYLDANGDVIGAEGDSILNPENLEELETLLKQQQSASEREAFEKKQMQMLKEFVAATKKK